MKIFMVFHTLPSSASFLWATASWMALINRVALLADLSSQGNKNSACIHEGTQVRGLDASVWSTLWAVKYSLWSTRLYTTFIYHYRAAVKVHSHICKTLVCVNLAVVGLHGVQQEWSKICYLVVVTVWLLCYILKSESVEEDRVPKRPLLANVFKQLPFVFITYMYIVHALFFIDGEPNVKISNLTTVLLKSSQDRLIQPHILSMCVTFTYPPFHMLQTNKDNWTCGVGEDPKDTYSASSCKKGTTRKV